MANEEWRMANVERTYIESKRCLAIRNSAFDIFVVQSRGRKPADKLSAASSFFPSRDREGAGIHSLANFSYRAATVRERTNCELVPFTMAHSLFCN